MSGPEEELALLLAADRIEAPEREYRFAPPRRWRFDFAWVEHRLAVEVEGGHWVGGHAGRWFERDAEKYNAAAIGGWRVLRFTPAMIRDGRAVETVRLALGP